MPLKIVAGAASADDVFRISEDAAGSTLVFDVRANDGKNASRPLYSLDDGQPADLATGDPVGGAIPDRSALGAAIGINSNGTVSYSAGALQARIDALAPGETLEDSFVYAVLSASNQLTWQTVKVRIIGTNDAPVAVADRAAVNEGSLVSGNVGLNDRDVDNGAVLSFVPTGQLVPGFQMGSNGAWTFDASNAAYDSLAAGETKLVTVDYRVTDQYGASAVSTLQIVVTGTNDAPKAGIATSPWPVDEGQVITGNLYGVDPDRSDTLTFSAAGELPAGFTLGADGNCRFDAGDPAYDHLAAGDTQSVTIAYLVRDPSGATAFGSMLFTVRGTNDAPVLEAGSASFAEDSQASGRLVARDADQGAVLTYALVGEAPAGFALAADGSWTFDASHPAYQGLAEGETRTLLAATRVTDEQGASSDSTLALTVTGTNDAPVLDAQAASLFEDSQASGRLIASDPDGGALLSFALTGEAPAGFALAADGSWTFDGGNAAYQGLGYFESMTLTVPTRVTDERGASSDSVLTITLFGANDAPVLGAVTVTVGEDQFSSGQLIATDSDTNAQLFYSVVGEAPEGLTLYGDGSWYFTPTATLQGLGDGESVAFSVRTLVRDDVGASSEATFDLTVVGSNDAPTLRVGSSSLLEDQVATGKLAGSDPDTGAVLTYSVVGPPITGFTLAQDGTWTFDTRGQDFQFLTEGQRESITVTTRVTDEHGASSDSHFVLAVTGINDAPAPQSYPFTQSVSEDGRVSGQLPSFDPDERVGVVFSVVGAVPDGFALSTGGEWSFAPGASFQSLHNGQSQSVQVTYKVTDSLGASGTATIDFLVQGANDAPVTAPLSAIVSEDEVRTGQITATDADAGDSLTYSLAGTAPQGIALTSSGQLSFNGADPYWQALGAGETVRLDIGYAVRDLGGASTNGIVSLTIVGSNDAAIITGTTSGTVVERSVHGGGTPLASGQLQANDIDNAGGFAFQNAAISQYGYGRFSITSAGSWEYSLDDANPAVNGLNYGQTLTDYFTVRSIDGTSQLISITIKGAVDSFRGPDWYVLGGDPNDFDAPVPGGSSAATIYGTDGSETLIGDASSQSIYSFKGDDIVWGGAGNDKLYGMGGNDVMYGQAGDDWVFADGWGVNRVYGGSGADEVRGGGGNDFLFGGSSGYATDSLNGFEGDDVLVGGYGIDNLIGGAGRDTFRFLDVRDTGDVILDYQEGEDILDFVAIDANRNQAGDQAFGWAGNTPTAYSLWAYTVNGKTVIYGDTDGNPATGEFEVSLQNIVWASSPTQPAGWLM
ncbi:hypothetical protein GCM10022281_18370 [Sphingomonas rosea]|uniref:Cadherin domain-containing protein n=1 Tax=Sphingomonas rosea TaxID=335605 RepID=A0ABP7UAY6_9SPHN